MAYADFFGIENLRPLARIVPSSELSSCAICRRFAHFCRDLLDAVLRVIQVEQGFESLRLLQRVNVAALQVFD